MITEDFVVHLIGCGGTGSWFDARAKRNLQKARGVGYWDNDIVEEKNLLNQNFEKEDVGSRKDKVLADRHGIVGVEEGLYSGANLHRITSLDEDDHETICIVVAATDDINIQRLIAENSHADYIIDVRVGRFDGNDIIQLMVGTPEYCLTEGDYSDVAGWNTPGIFPEYEDLPACHRPSTGRWAVQRAGEYVANCLSFLLDGNHSYHVEVELQPTEQTKWGDKYLVLDGKLPLHWNGKE